MLKVIILLLSFNSFSTFVYITDEVDIPIRSDKKFEDNIIRSLPSGSKLNILKTDSDGWTQIKFESTTGWVISRYLTNNPPARLELERLKITANANKLLLKKQISTKKIMEDRLLKLNKNSKDNEIAALKAQAEKKHIEKTYQESLKIEHENTRLRQINLNLQSEIKLLNANNETQIENSNRTWFLYGGFLLVIGVLLGFIISIKNRR